MSVVLSVAFSDGGMTGQHALVPPTAVQMRAGEADTAQIVGFLMYPCRLPCFISVDTSACS